MVMNSKQAQKVLQSVNRKEVVKLVEEMVNIPSPTGQEKEMGVYVERKFRELGLKTIVQWVEDDRPNVIGVLSGSGGGGSLLFDGHLDVSFSGTEDFMAGGSSTSLARVEKDWIFGVGSFNMKGAIAAYIGCVKAIIDSGVKLNGDLTIAAVTGEIEASQVDGFKGGLYRGYGRGSQYMTSHGIVPDFVILGEPTGLKIMLGHFGSFWAKITATGGTVTHTAWSRGLLNKIEQMPKVIETFKKWKKEFESRIEYKGYNGLVNLAAIQGGRPWKGSRTPDSCSLYIDVRYPPTMSPIQIRAELDRLVEGLNSEDPTLKIELEPYISNPATEISKEDYIVSSIQNAHKQILNRDTEMVYDFWYSDAPSFNAAGSKAVNYGPSGATKLEGLTLSDRDREYINITDLINCTKIYSLVALDVCSKPRSKVRPDLSS